MHGSGLRLPGVAVLSNEARILSNALANPECRRENADALARHLGARALLILIPDREVGALRPAPGFPQTLPGGPTWRALLARCREGADFETEIAYPNADTLEAARVLVWPDRTALIFIGCRHTISRSELEDVVPLISALLRSESAGLEAAGHARAAQDASRRARELAAALDGARGEIAGKADQLRRALSESARLNAELRLLNETLEERILDRTRELEVEVEERRKAEAALAQAQKMEAVGQLTGGIAHDFNNLLQVVVGNLDILQRNLPEDASRLRRSADNAMKGARRAATLTQRLLAFSRRQPLDPKRIDVNALVSGMSDLLHRSLGETVAVETVVAAGLWRVEADANQLENAILNLAVNARDAMPDGGKLTIETANTMLDEAYARAHAEVRPGQYVVLSVSDTGVGMDRETAERVFEPFFTTKEVGKGTGLGLSMVYGFAKQSGGHVKIYSEPLVGTTVKIYLPRLIGGRSDEEDPEPNISPEGGGKETILVVEDDEDVRAYSVETLRELGYQVIEAQDGPSALRVLERQAAVDLLFTDVVLPNGLNGERLARDARALRPRIKVLFTTGYSRNAIVHHGRLDAGVQLIAKPYSYADLATKVRDVLDGL
ncbi:response regulator [Micromonospora sp. STR1s_5]|nr:response regulator [Micromonospora sp. STR1s_5]